MSLVMTGDFCSMPGLAGSGGEYSGTGMVPPPRDKPKDRMKGCVISSRLAVEHARRKHLVRLAAQGLVILWFVLIAGEGAPHGLPHAEPSGKVSWPTLAGMEVRCPTPLRLRPGANSVPLPPALSPYSPPSVPGGVSRG